MKSPKTLMLALRRKWAWPPVQAGQLARIEFPCC